MKCVICNTEYEGGRCPVCGFQPVRGIVGDDPQAKSDYEQIVENYRKNFIGNLQLSVVAYEWKANDEEVLVLDKKHYIKFPKEEKIEFGKVYWIKEPFARTLGEVVELTIAIENGSQEVKEVTVPVRIPVGENFWYVGAALIGGKKAVIHLKTVEGETASEAFDVL